MFTKYLTLKLKNNSVKTVSVHPGVVRTSFFNRTLVAKPLIKLLICLFYPFIYCFSKSAYWGAQTTLYCCNEDFGKLTEGGYYADC